MHGEHVIKTWSSTQNHITLSSCEAELMGMSKGASEAIGLSQMYEEWGRHPSVEVRTDSSAAIGTAHRAGNGRLRHVRISDLWLQERVSEGSISISKVAGNANVADMLTKDAPRKVRETLLASLPFSFDMKPSEKQLQIYHFEISGEELSPWCLRKGDASQQARDGRALRKDSSFERK